MKHLLTALYLHYRQSRLWLIQSSGVIPAAFDLQAILTTPQLSPPAEQETNATAKAVDDVDLL